MLHECQFDGLVGPTHNYGGLSAGNLASQAHGSEVSNPRGAALQGLAKMRFIRSLGVTQAVLPPHPRPSLALLHRLGFRGKDEEMLAQAARDGGGAWLRVASSASAMWTANAATVVPSLDAADGRAHFIVANLARMPHRSIEPDATERALRTIFAEVRRFAVHPALPPAFSDEGAANHTRLATSRGVVHLFAWGRSLFDGVPAATRLPARQTREASEAIARLALLPRARCRFPQQHPAGIDGGAFHTDVLAVGSGRFLMLHPLAFSGDQALLADLRDALGEELVIVQATEDELPVARAVGAYPFNSQCLWVGRDEMVIVAPADAHDDPAAHRFLARAAAEVERSGARARVCFLDLQQSMHNGGGPACLRLRVPLTPTELGALGARVILDDALVQSLVDWITHHYRDRLAPDDLADPSLHRAAMTALDELTRLLRLGTLYDFQSPDDPGDGHET